MNNYYIGIDVGLKGAVAIVDGNDVLLHDMPERHCFRDLERVFTAMPNDKCRVVIESQNPFPGQGVVSVYSLGWQVGYIHALLEYLKMPYEEVRPTKWMKFYGLVGKKRADGKKALYAKAQKLYPTAELRSPRGALKDGRVDALLIAHYCRNVYLK